MAYTIELDAPLGDELARIAADQAGKARHAMLGGMDDRDEAIHEARKRFKKLRGLYRLVRKADGRFYTRENARLRDAARALSVVRDAAALVETLDRLRADPISAPVRADLDHVRDRLAERRDAVAERSGGLDEAIAAAVKACDATVEAAEAARMPGDSAAAAACLSAGFSKTYKRGRKALAKARKTDIAEDWHDLRKRMKYHFMHCRLLRQAWPDTMALRAREAKAGADMLGDDHDLAVLEQLLRADPDAVGEPGARENLIHVMHLSSERLRGQAVARLEPILSDRPGNLEDAIRALCRTAA